MSFAPLVSVVLPTYNGSKYIIESVDSIIAQSFRDWELIIVDDASTDATPEIIRRYTGSDIRIRCCRNQQNLKLPRSLNEGFRYALGKYFSWTSDDNVYLPNALERMVQEIGKGVDFVYAEQGILDESGVRVGKFGIGQIEDILARNPINACFLYRREIQDVLGGYDADLFLVEDWDFWLRAAGRFKMVGIEEELYHYRRHSGSLSESRRRECVKSFIRMVRKNWEQIRANPKWSVDALLGLAEAHNELGEHRASLRALGTAIAIHPIGTFGRRPKSVARLAVNSFPRLRKSLTSR